MTDENVPPPRVRPYPLGASLLEMCVFFVVDNIAHYDSLADLSTEVAGRIVELLHNKGKLTSSTLRLFLSVNLPVTNLTLAKLPVNSHWMKLVARFSLLEHLNLRKTPIKPADLKHLTSLKHSLIGLNLSNCDGLSSAADEALAIINQLRNLHDLSLDDWHLRSKPEESLSKLNKLKGLQRLSLQRNSKLKKLPADFGAHHPQLIYLNLGWSGFRQQYLRKLFKQLPHLEHLVLEGIELDAETMADAFSTRRPPALRSLDVSATGLDRLDWLEQAGGELQSLNISATLVTDLSALPATLLSLEAVHAPLTDDAVRHIRARCPALQNLNLSFTPVTDRILPVIGEMMGRPHCRLTNVKLAQCENISMDAVRALGKQHPHAFIFGGYMSMAELFPLPPGWEEEHEQAMQQVALDNPEWLWEAELEWAAQEMAPANAEPQ